MNQDHLISKKDLLARYGISYGALYRWKRKGLIPDEWFIKKSTTTGQETFFPEKLVCERIEMIQKMKEDVLLDDRVHRGTGAVVGVVDVAVFVVQLQNSQPWLAAYRKIHHRKVDVLVVHDSEGIQPVGSGMGRIARVFQNSAHKHADAGIVLHHQDMKHKTASLGKMIVICPYTIADFSTEAHYFFTNL